ncbi:30S ribosomal protein S11 [bacterium]|nr:30S ribosomal protein S11 [bacterium]MBU1025738.1 30S ribosomal protein S11 [bacterium]
MAKQPKKRTAKKKVKKSVLHGVAHIQSTFNNTIITVSDLDGNVLAWSSGGCQGFKGSKKSTPFAATLGAQSVVKKLQEFGLRKLDIFTKGPGSGREASIRALMSAGMEIVNIKDISPIPHNGCRPKKRRRT